KGSPDYGELKSSKMLVPYLKIEQYGLESFIDKDNLLKEDMELAKKGWDAALKAITNNDYDMVILDELNIAIDFHLLDLKEVIEGLNRRNPALDIIITGRYAPDEIIDIADTVSEVTLVKHHYYKGISAREGIEY
ncbi:MAG: cob(I)yrinic acid a,c-diamide adenosyltransferase, partial [Candidatus Stahlbacteria bacterium]|nr:cob(I)yrinic acid a,c-diamide adenosyltransferase [Candidatus Stahlbacteria bacterium]